MNVVGMVRDFVEQSKRVISITHKPKPHEFKQMAFTTAIGMALIGIIGFLISMAAVYLKGV